jgi:hypothetical protein
MQGMANAVGLLVVAVMFLASCTTWQPLGSYEPQSQRDYNRDLYKCEREATFARGDNKQQVFDSCMKARGYAPSSTDRFEWPHTQ